MAYKTTNEPKHISGKRESSKSKETVCLVWKGKKCTQYTVLPFTKY